MLGLCFTYLLYLNKISTVAIEEYIVNEYLTRKLNKPHGVSSKHFYAEYMDKSLIRLALTVRTKACSFHVILWKGGFAPE